MPAFYAHRRFGEEVYKILPTAYQNCIDRYPDTFLLGTQGPDVLFYHTPIKPNEIRKRASFLHTVSGEEFFLGQAEKLLQTANSGDMWTDNGAFTAYILGVLCHFTLDASCHLYIDGQKNDVVTHGKIESEFDKYLLRKDGKPIRGYNYADPIRDTEETRDMVVKAFGLTEAEASLCIKTIRKYTGWFSKKCELFHALVHVVLKVAGHERQFGDMFLHKKDDPLCVEHNAVLWKQWQNAIPTAKEVIEAYFERLTEWVETQQINIELFRYDFGGIIITKE